MNDASEARWLHRKHLSVFSAMPKSGFVNQQRPEDDEGRYMQSQAQVRGSFPPLAQARHRSEAISLTDPASSCSHPSTSSGECCASIKRRRPVVPTSTRHLPCCGALILRRSIPIQPRRAGARVSLQDHAAADRVFRAWCALVWSTRRPCRER